VAWPVAGPLDPTGFAATAQLLAAWAAQPRRRPFDYARLDLVRRIIDGLVPKDDGANRENNW
jgi:hypothetical protein